MERFFLALMVSGLLLAVAAASLFVATTGADDRTASVMNLPSPPSAYLKREKPREGQKTGKETVGRH
jgi:hypothetical protein